MSKGIKVFFIQKEYFASLSNKNSIPSFCPKDFWDINPLALSIPFFSNCTSKQFSLKQALPHFFSGCFLNNINNPVVKNTKTNKAIKKILLPIFYYLFNE